MKKIVLLVIIALSCLFASAQSIGWVHLNNGNIVKGIVNTTDTEVIITTEDGSELSYPLLEVNKITSKAPKMPKVGVDPDLNDYSETDKGFWYGVQLGLGYTVISKNHNAPWHDLDFVGGYRFNQFLKVGAGFGWRFYYQNSNLRHKRMTSSFPLYATVRGNIVRDTYRTVVPYYSFDIGGAICDGVMWRPSFGIRVGQSRSAFLLSVTYTGQSLQYFNKEQKYVSSLGLTVGYEF